MIFKPYYYETAAPRTSSAAAASAAASARRALAFEPLEDGQEIELDNSDVPSKPAAMEQILRINQGRAGNTP